FTSESMQEFFRIVENPRECSYLPLETASLEIRAIEAINPVEYADLLARGYRRFGWRLFRPACPNCAQCRSLRVLISQFTPNASGRRVLRQNQTVRAELHAPFVSREQVELYNLYHRFQSERRGWPRQRATLASYHDEFLSGATNLGRQWLYFEADRL